MYEWNVSQAKEVQIGAVYEENKIKSEEIS
jgi:hypothetical protein